MVSYHGFFRHRAVLFQPNKMHHVRFAYVLKYITKYRRIYMHQAWVPIPSLVCFGTEARSGVFNEIVWKSVGLIGYPFIKKAASCRHPLYPSTASSVLPSPTVSLHKLGRRQLVHDVRVGCKVLPDCRLTVCEVGMVLKTNRRLGELIKSSQASSVCGSAPEKQWAFFRLNPDGGMI